MSEILVNTIKKADGTGSLTVPAETGTVLTNTAPSIAGDVTFSQEAASSPYPEQQIKWSNDSTTANGFYISQDSDRNGRVWHEQGLEVLFGTSNSEAMRIDSSQRVIIGDTSTFGDTGAQLCVSNRGSVSGGISIGNDVTDSNVNCITFMNFNGQVGRIRTTSTATEYITSSDYRLKENVVDLTDAIDRVKTLPVHRFNFIADPSKTVDGFLAHEAQAVVPESVAGDKDEVDDEGNPVYQGIDQSKLVPLLTGALQEAIAKIETLETTVADLQTRVTALEGA